jgi:hypothetical protein
MQVLGGPGCVCTESAAIFPVMLFAKGAQAFGRSSVLQVLTSADLENT